MTGRGTRAFAAAAAAVLSAGCNTNDPTIVAACEQAQNALDTSVAAGQLDLAGFDAAIATATAGDADQFADDLEVSQLGLITGAFDDQLVIDASNRVDRVCAANGVPLN